MSSSTVAFLLVSLVTVIAAARLVVTSDVRATSRSLIAVGLGCAGAMVLMVAPTAAVFAGACGIGGAIALAHAGAAPRDASQALADDDSSGLFGRGRGRGRRLFSQVRRSTLVVGGLAALLLWIFAGTLARQYVSYGADLGRRPEFGELPGLAHMLATRFSPALLGVVLLAAVAMYALVAQGDDARGSDLGPDRDRGGRR